MSSISSVGSAASGVNPYQDQKDQFKQDFKALSQALKSGDLQGAQSAFAQIEQLQQKKSQNGQASTSGQSQSQGAQDMQALGQALSSGNLQDAQQAFSKLQQDMQSHKGGHHHGGGQAQSATSATSPATADTSSSGASTTNITINVEAGSTAAIYA